MEKSLFFFSGLTAAGFGMNNANSVLLKKVMVPKNNTMSIFKANLAFRDGMTIPLMSEFLSYAEGDTDEKKDCELKAFYRLAARLKSFFPALKIMLLLDGLYAKGPVVELCRKNKWQFMIVLKDKSLPSVMSEFEAISQLDKKNIHRYK